MPIAKKSAVKKRKRSTTTMVNKSCKCCTCKGPKPSRPPKPSKPRKRKKTAKRKSSTKRAVVKKVVKRKTRKKATTSSKALNGLEGPVFRLSRLQKRLLPPAMQKAILERQRKMGKTIVE